MIPEFLKRLQDPSIRNVFLCGCGGGFDFVHSMLLYPELKRLGKNVVIGSYSFGDPNNISNSEDVLFVNGSKEEISVKKVSSKSIPHQLYGPEVHLCTFLDERYPDDVHEIYAYYARSFTVPSLTNMYNQLIEKHNIDCVVTMDGGSDSLMSGDEEGLGDPIEDCVSVTSVALLSNPRLKEKLLLTVGLGCDRFNHVSDASSLRAISELSCSGGFLGSISVMDGMEEFKFYRDAVNYIESKQEFHSVLSRSIIAAGEGLYGYCVPCEISGRVKPRDLYLWPLMSHIWGFDVEHVANRSLLSQWIRGKTTVPGMYEAYFKGRKQLESEGKLRKVENFPVAEQRGFSGRFMP